MKEQKEFKWIPMSNKKLKQRCGRVIETENIIYVSQPRCFICGKFFKVNLDNRKSKKGILNSLKVFICKKCKGQRYSVPFKSQRKSTKLRKKYRGTEDEY